MKRTSEILNSYALKCIAYTCRRSSWVPLETDEGDVPGAMLLWITLIIFGRGNNMDGEKGKRKNELEEDRELTESYFYVKF